MEQTGLLSFADLTESRVFIDFFTIVRELTGARVALIEPSSNSLTRLYPLNDESPLCHLIHSVPLGAKMCRIAGCRPCEEIPCRQPGTRYLCHAGLLGMAAPLIIDNQHVATITCSQVLPEAPSEPLFLQCLEKIAEVGIPTVSLRRAYFATPHLPPEKSNLFLRLCTSFAGYYCKTERLLRDRSLLGERREVTEAKRYLQQHFREAITLEDTARRVNLSPAYFSTIFHRETGMNYTEYLQCLRVDEAKRLLETTDLGISRIASALGYHSLTHFNRVFRKLGGCAPSQYRKRQGQHPSPQIADSESVDRLIGE